MAKILDGKMLSSLIKEELALEVKKMIIQPHLAVVRIGEDPASKIYVNGKREDAKEIGIDFTEIALTEDTKEDTIIAEIEALNRNTFITGIIVQLPIPKHLNERRILNTINFHKDIDGLTTSSIGALYAGEPTNIPCTPKGVIRLLKHYKIKIKGKNVVIVGRSNLVGKPLANLFLQEDATVTICHSQTKDLKSYTKNADILVSAVGKKELITKDMIKEGATIVDVGISRGEGKKIYGDADFPNVIDKVSAITPVPGGVGPMTRVMLLENIIKK